MKKLAILMAVMMLVSTFSMMLVSADAISIFGSNAALKKGNAHLLVEKGDAAKQLIVAGFNGSTLTNATPVTIESGSGIQEVKVPDLGKDATSAKFFLWDNLDDITPLATPMTKDLTQEDYYTIELTASDMAQVGWAYGSSSTKSTRIGTNRAIPVLKGSVITYNVPSTLRMCIDYFPFIGAGANDGVERKYWIGSNSTSLASSGTYTVPEDGYVGLTFCDAASSSNALPLSSYATHNPEITIQIPYQTDREITSNDIAPGGYRFGTTTTASDRIRVNSLIYLKKGSTVNYNVGDLQIHLANLENGEEANAYAQASGWKKGSGTFTFDADGYLAVIMMIADGTPISVSDYDKYGASISIREAQDMAIITPDNIEHGAWGHGCKMDDSANLTERLRVNYLVPVNNGGVLSYNLPSGIQMYVRQVKAPTTVNSADNTIQGVGWKSGTGTITAITQDGYFAIAFKKYSSSGEVPIGLSDYNAQVAVYRGTASEPEQPIDTTSTYPANHRIIKEFGGQGNDWSFVYLPDDYYTNTSKTYPFVILNHGNGWNMDGTEQKANYSNITMYMPNTTANQSNSRYNCTDDSSIWYSNPTIEALLDAGYIVAGAQNYGDNLYGNDNCRKACADFYEYLVDTYRVQADNCFMVGASNGCMTTLNAANYLWNYKQVKIKGVILQYPLCGLKTHYLAGGHNSNIKTAYGIASDVTLTDANFYDYIDEEFDPVATDVKTQGYFPAIKIYYSNSDTTTRASANATPLINSLTSQGVTVDTKVCSGNHGDLTHFDAEGFVTWFNSHLN